MSSVCPSFGVFDKNVRWCIVQSLMYITIAFFNVYKSLLGEQGKPLFYYHQYNSNELGIDLEDAQQQMNQEAGQLEDELEFHPPQLPLLPEEPEDEAELPPLAPEFDIDPEQMSDFHRNIWDNDILPWYAEITEKILATGYDPALEDDTDPVEVNFNLLAPNCMEPICQFRIRVEYRDRIYIAYMWYALINLIPGNGIIQGAHCSANFVPPGVV